MRIVDSEQLRSLLETSGATGQRPPIFLYGAGNTGKNVCQSLSRRGIDITAFLDQHAAGQLWHGRPVLQPDSPDISPAVREQSVTLVCVFNPDADVLGIVGRLETLGYGCAATFPHVHAVLESDLGDCLWLTKTSFLAEQQTRIADCRALWADETSRDLYDALLKFRSSGDYTDLPLPDTKNQYFPPDIPAWKTPLRFVDCGAYDGDTLDQAGCVTGKVAAIAAFEPDAGSFGKLTAFVRANAAALPAETALWPCGVWSHTTQLSFSGGGLEGSCLLTDGSGYSVSCVALDDVIPLFRPNLIKMDVEGAEYEALWGARRLIQESRPGLAICLYHRPAHLWQIPLLLKEWDLGYRFFLRLHGYSGFETVLYAVSE